MAPTCKGKVRMSNLQRCFVKFWDLVCTEVCVIDLLVMEVLMEVRQWLYTIKHGLLVHFYVSGKILARQSHVRAKIKT